MRAVSVVVLALVLASCGSDDPSPAAPSPSPTSTPVASALTLQEVADVLDCRGPVQGEAGYVGIRCQDSAADLTIAEWGDEERADIELMNGSMVGDPDLWFMATDSITVSATDPAVIDEARQLLS